MPLEILCNALGDTPALGDDAAFGDLEHLFVTTSLELAAQAVTNAARGAPFAALDRAAVRLRRDAGARHAR